MAFDDSVDKEVSSKADHLQAVAHASVAHETLLPLLEQCMRYTSGLTLQDKNPLQRWKTYGDNPTATPS
jgi:hypothetical protein